MQKEEERNIEAAEKRSLNGYRVAEVWKRTKEKRGGRSEMEKDEDKED